MSDGPLPPDWEATTDPSSGNTYYYNTKTNAVSWERPRGGPPPPPPPPPGGGPPGGGGGGAYSASDVFSGEELSARSDDISAWCKKNEVTLSQGCPDPYTSYESARLPPQILQQFTQAGFTGPTPIQAASWAPAMRGFDVVGVAKTGSGKTLGFLVPAFLRIMQERKDPRQGPTTLVMAPTRELATQIQDECVKFGRCLGMNSVCLYGGAPKGPQLGEVRRGVYIIIVTPGRLNDFLEAGQVRMHQVNYVVMDEADRMLDMGFEPQIRKIISHVPRGYQSLMYTATWPREVRSMASEFQRRPYQITIGTADEKLTANKDVEQRVLLVGSPQEKDGHLISQINTLEPGSRVLIFCSTKRMCDTLCRALARQIGCNAMHGDKEQRERERILHEFKTGRSPIMVATDVAARGLDIKEIRMVINYDFPPKTEDYIHRIGRTGRAGAKGVAVTFMGAQDAKHASELTRIMRDANQPVPQELEQMATFGGGGGGGGRRGGGGGGGFRRGGGGGGG
jgi:ATP-dependent RNA helicase DDX5/DBP2